MTAPLIKNKAVMNSAKCRPGVLALLAAFALALGACGSDSEPGTKTAVDGSAVAAAGLTGRWMLLELDGEPISKPLRGKAYVEFLADGSAVAHSGVTSTPLQAQGELSKGRVDFVVGATPIVPGRNPAAEFEQIFLGRLAAVSAFEISQDRLELKSDGNIALLLQGQ